MADKEQEIHQDTQVKTREAVQVKEEVNLQEELDKLGQYGGFGFLETTVDGVQNMNPKRKARKKIFLKDNKRKEERIELKKRLQTWVKLLSSSDNILDMVEQCEKKSDSSEKLLKKNLKKAIDATSELEKSYRTVAMFFNNAEADKVRNISFVNASKEQMTDLDNPTFINRIAKELDDQWDRLDLRDNYSILVMPGYLDSKKVIDKWGKIVHKNKVMLVTDYRHLDEVDDVMEMFKDDDLAGGDAHLSNVIMTCNWLVGREAVKEIGEDEPLYVPGSSSLAGVMYRTLMSQVAAGKKFGSLNEVDGVTFPLKKSEIANLEKMGLVPMVKEYGKVMAFSAKTLFNGDNQGLQTYSVVRVFDWVMKVLMDFLNRRAFENWSIARKKELRKQIVAFLDKMKDIKLISDFKILRFDRDTVDKQKVFLDIHLEPYFPAKNFMIALSGTRGESASDMTWERAEYGDMEK